MVSSAIYFYALVLVCDASDMRWPGYVFLALESIVASTICISMTLGAVCAAATTISRYNWIWAAPRSGGIHGFESLSMWSFWLHNNNRSIAYFCCYGQKKRNQPADEMLGANINIDMNKHWASPHTHTRTYNSKHFNWICTFYGPRHGAHVHTHTHP